MKALLIRRGVTPPKTHDLVRLDGMLRAACSQWAWSLEDLRFLTRAAVDFRYPGEAADKEQAVEALAIAK